MNHARSLFVLIVLTGCNVHSDSISGDFDFLQGEGDFKNGLYFCYDGVVAVVMQSQLVQT